MLSRSLSPIIGIAVVCSTVSLAAQTWKSGDTLVYEILSESKISGGHLPSQAYASRPAQSEFIRIGVTGLDADGAALVHVKVDMPYPEGQFHLPGAGEAGARKGWEEQNRYKEFDSRLTRDGALLITVDNSLADNESSKPTSMSQADLARFRDAMVNQIKSPEYQANLAKNEVAGTFQIPNIVALSCAKRTTLAMGDSWHVVSKTNTATYDVSVQGNQSYHGHNTVVLNVKSTTENPNGSAETTATVYYDPQGRLVIGMHTVTVSNIKVTGMTSTATSDFNLK